MARTTFLRNILLAAIGWICLVLFAVALVSGRGRTATDYARVLLDPVATGQPILAGERRRAIWSGWQLPSASGERLSNAANPDILFRAAAAARDCDVLLAAHPLLVGNETSQRIIVSLNGVTSPPLFAGAGGVYRFAHAGDLIDGVNTLSFRLPDAGRATPTDEHVLAIGLRSVTFECRQRS